VRFDFVVGVVEWSVGCVAVRLSGLVERGVSGDNSGSVVASLTGVRKVRVSGELDDGELVSGRDGEEERVGILDSSSEGG
jgi:hypothetical protein